MLNGKISFMFSLNMDEYIPSEEVDVNKALTANGLILVGSETTELGINTLKEMGHTAVSYIDFINSEDTQVSDLPALEAPQHAKRVFLQCAKEDKPLIVVYGLDTNLILPESSFFITRYCLWVKSSSEAFILRGFDLPALRKRPTVSDDSENQLTITKRELKC